ncbi:transporter substrate-binding protein, partial [Rathayibacter sp. AY1D5]
AVEAATHSQCLALFQAGEVDAIAGDDTILAGFVAQDPYAKVVGDALSSEPYGLGLPADDPDFVRFVNASLESIRSDGRWQSIYERWLGVLGEASPPAPVYGR